ncbi:Mor transcription activator family protein [Aeromonas enteropelogenes]|uniref:Mor transcription activator family protein n=1 Tax=Aeromonas enteropelogenes TaxID=29489 RepID=UPI003BA36D7F
MENQNLSLFSDDDAARLLDQMDEIPTDELLNGWPERLSEMFHVLQSELGRGGIEAEQSIKLAAKCAGALACYMGGRAVYVPNGQSMKQSLRDNMIFAEFNGSNIEQLSREYVLSHPAIYKIIAKQRKLLAARLQPDLFASVAP